MTGTTNTPGHDNRHELLEMMVDLDLAGFEDPEGIQVPYIVTVDCASTKILSIYRNWEEQDENKKRRDHC